jgi:hypothetical protein
MMIQNVYRKTTSNSTSGTHRYDGAIAASSVKYVITRHESRRPSPKATGPNVPAENLQREANHRIRPTAQVGEMVHVRQDVRIRGKPYKENLHEARFGLFLDGDWANTYQVVGA